MAKEKKSKKTTSEKGQPGRPPGRKILGLDERVQRLAPGEDPRVSFYPEERPDYETATQPDDAYAKLKYPPPKVHPTFRKMWGGYIDSIVERENFKEAHLTQLEILCDLHVEYEQLQAFIRKNGRSYKVVGRAGSIWKLFPEVLHLSKVAGQIQTYMKMMGLVLKKDSSVKNPGEKESWD